MIEIYPGNNSVISNTDNNNTEKIQNDDTLPYIQIIIDNSSSLNKSLADIVHDNIKKYNASEPFIKNVTIDNNSKLGNQSAIKFEYELIDGDTPMKAMEITSMMGNKIYYFDYAAGQQDYDILLPQIQEIVDSSHFNK